MQRGIGNRKTVCPSVCLSFRLSVKLVHCDKTTARSEILLTLKVSVTFGVTCSWNVFNLTEIGQSEAELLIT